MLHIKSCNVKHNSESVFCYFASAVKSIQSTKRNRKDIYAICSYWSLQKVGYVPLYTFRKSLIGIQQLGFKSPCIQCSSSARLDGIHTVQIHVIGIHLTSTVSLIERLSLYEFTLSGRDLVSVVHIRENLYYSFFFYRKYMRILLGHCKLSVIERCPY